MIETEHQDVSYLDAMFQDELIPAFGDSLRPIVIALDRAADEDR